jgi:hypothetical protein
MKIRNLSELNKYPIPEHIKQQIVDAYRKKKNGDNTPHSVADMEPASRNESVSAYSGETFDSPVHIDIYSRRKKKTDIDNVSGKAALDGIVNCGILETDSPDQIESYRVHKPEISPVEQTVIVIEEV